jgi:hypothetical protein
MISLPSVLRSDPNSIPHSFLWFTEGFDTKDLQEAKALPQELS